MKKIPSEVYIIVHVYNYSLFLLVRTHAGFCGFLSVSVDSIFQLSPEQVGELQSLLLRVADEVCDIICSASTAALMNLGLRDYGRLQTLLAVRY